ncbi:putative pentatricopeptide repeat-containing protein [Platanthera zijinensis]|uniref:Pentatricopeptide repeat-containing protein n=1 Tax=Platanthera zijinensis TaxID=2320716 RepID=A0AAP0G3T6_9ASPA
MTKLALQQLTSQLALRQKPSLIRPISPLAAATDLIKSHFDSGRLSDARRVFDELPDRDVVAWTAMVSGYASNARPEDAWGAFRAMASAGVSPNAFTVSSILSACRSGKFTEGTAAVHALSIRLGVKGQTHVDNAMIYAYSESHCGMLDALQVFDEITQRSAVSWTTIVAAYVRRGDGGAAAQMCRRMFQEGVELNPFTLSIAIRASAAAENLALGRQIHAAASKTGHAINLPVSNSIVDMYSRCASLSEARQHFGEMPQKDLITWNTMIAALDRAGSVESCRLLLDMLSQSIQPNCFTFTSIISSCAKLSCLIFGQQVHGAALRRGFGENHHISNVLIDMYAKCGAIADSRRVFDETCGRSLVSWTSMIIGYGVHGFGEEAIKLFNEMIGYGIQPDAIVFMGVISACSHAGLVEEGLEFFNSMESRYGVSPDAKFYGCVVDLLGRSGRLREAAELIEAMPFEPDESVFGALLGACKMHKKVELGVAAGRKMLNLRPEGAKTYVILSNIYAAGSEWDWFSEVMKMMRGMGWKKDVGMSWIEVREEVCCFVAGEQSSPSAALASEVLTVLGFHMDEEGDLLFSFGSVWEGGGGEKSYISNSVVILEALG